MVSVTSPPIAQEQKKGKVEPEQEPNDVVTAETDVDEEGGEDYIPTPVKSLNGTFDGVATPNKVTLQLGGGDASLTVKSPLNLKHLEMATPPPKQPANGIVPCQHFSKYLF